MTLHNYLTRRYGVMTSDGYTHTIKAHRAGVQLVVNTSIKDNVSNCHLLSVQRCKINFVSMHFSVAATNLFNAIL